jgi:hypothetical protein
MMKKHLNLLIDAGLLQKARDNGLVISKFLELKLQEYFSFIDMVSKSHPHFQKDLVGLSEFESESLAPKAKRMDQATLQAPYTRCNDILYLKIFMYSCLFSAAYGF